MAQLTEAPCDFREVLARFCAFFGSGNEVALNSSCTQEGRFCRDDCDRTYGCLNSLAFTFPNVYPCAQTAQPAGICVPVNETLYDEVLAKLPVAPVVISPRTCPADSGPVTVPLLQVELGPMFDYLVCNPLKNASCSVDNLAITDGNVTIPIRKVWRDVPFSILFPAKCNKIFSTLMSKPWAGWNVFQAVWNTLALALFTYRRNKPPISARSFPLVFVFVLSVIFGLLILSDSSVYQLTGTCLLANTVTTLIFCPLTYGAPAVRSLRLYFLYLWNQSKRDPKKAEWFFKRKHWVQNPRLFAFWSIWILIGFFLFWMYYIHYPRWFVQGTLADSGRCDWWDFNAQVQAFAESKGKSLGPSILNPDGYVPFSAHFDSCKFCQLTDTWWLGNTLYVDFWFIGSIGSIYLIRNLNDQYAIWYELRVQLTCFTFLLFLNTWWPISSYREATQINATDNILFVLAHMLVFLACLSATVYPLVLSYLWEHRDRNQHVDTTRTHAQSIILKEFKLKQDPSGKIFTDKAIPMEVVLADQLGIEAFRHYCVEAFVAENVVFLERYNDYLKINELAAKREMAKTIYNESIKINSINEVNISYSMKVKYEKLFEHPSQIGQNGTSDHQFFSERPNVAYSRRPEQQAPQPARDEDAVTREDDLSSRRLVGVDSPNQSPSTSELRTLEEKGSKPLPVDSATLRELNSYYADVRVEIFEMIKGDWYRFLRSRFYQELLEQLWQELHFQQGISKLGLTEAGADSKASVGLIPSKAALEAGMGDVEMVTATRPPADEPAHDPEERHDKGEHKDPRDDAHDGDLDDSAHLRDDDTDMFVV